MNNDNNDNRIYDEETGQEEVQYDTSSGSSTRRKKKPRVKKKRKKKYYALRFLIFILVCVTAYFVLHSAAFTVEEIQLEENDRFTLKQVKEITGLKKGVNMFEIKTSECEKKLEENAYIREAEVKRQLPDTITVSLDLREPVAVIKHKDKYVLVDREGTVLDIRERLPYYTVLAGITVESAKKGQAVSVKETEKYQQYMELIDKMNQADLYFRGMVINKDGTIRLYVKKQLSCYGKKGNVVEGMEDGNLKAVLYNLNKKGVKKGTLEIGDEKYYSFRKSVK